MGKHTFWQLICGFSGLLAVIFGAAGAHAAPDALAGAIIEKAALYQLIHTTVLLWLIDKEGRIPDVTRYVLLAGVCLFSGSIYLKGFGLTTSALLAPFGGTLLMLGWLLLALSSIARPKV